MLVLRSKWNKYSNPLLKGENEDLVSLNHTPKIAWLKEWQQQAHICLSLRLYVTVLFVALPAIGGLSGKGIAGIPMSTNW